MTSKEINSKLIAEFPELTVEYNSEITWRKGDDTDSHVVYCGVLCQYLLDRLRERDDNAVKRVCNFLDMLIDSGDKYAGSIAVCGVIENLVFVNGASSLPAFLSQKLKVLYDLIKNGSVIPLTSDDENTVNIRKLNLKLLHALPELAATYWEEAEWQEGSFTGSHVIYGDVLTPYLRRKLRENDVASVKRVCDFINTLMESGGEYAENVIVCSVIESLVFAEGAETLPDYLSEKSLVYYNWIKEHG